MSGWQLYLVRCEDGKLYNGISTDVDRRFAEHQAGRKVGSKHLKGREPLSLVFRKRPGSESLALGVESKVKKLSKARKEKVIGSPEMLR